MGARSVKMAGPLIKVAGRMGRPTDERFRRAFDHAPAGMGIVSISGERWGRLLHVNSALCELTGYSEAELLEKEFVTMTHPEDRGDEAAAIAGLMSGERGSYESERRLIRADGEPVWVQVSASLIRDDTDRPLYGLGQLQDITARRAAAEMRSRLAAIVASSTDAIVATGLDGRIVAWNPGAEALFGHSAEDVVGHDLSILMPAEVRDEERPLIDSALAGESISARETWRLRKDGSGVEVSISVSPIRDEHGAVVGASEISRDMTDGPAATALRSSEERLRQIVDTASEGIWTIDRGGRTTFANRKLAEMLGTTVEAMDGVSAFDFVPEPGRAELRRRLTRRGERLSDTLELCLERADGGETWGLLSFSDLFDSDGTQTGALAMVVDITESRAAERELGQLQRLEGLGQLAGGVAHDMNNLLGVILNFSDFGVEQVGDGPGREELDEIQAAAERAATLTRQLLVFARREIVRPESVDLNRLVGSLESMLQRTIGEHITLSRRAGSGLPAVMVDPGLVEQVLVNLVVNARDAMPDGGHVTIATEAVHLTSAEVRSHIGLTPGAYVCLSVEDDGEGMTADVVSRAYDPFFTTKPVGSGTGLGLATVYGAVSKGGGRVKIDSEVGRGTVVSVDLPTSTGSEPAGAKPEPAAVSSTSGTVLVVEDDAGLRAVAVRILELHGHHVLATGRPTEALEIMGGESCAVELVVTDVVMPEMSGPQMAKRLEVIRPQVPVVFLSGYTDRPEDLPAGATLLQKPFTRAELLREVGSALPKRFASAPRDNADGER